MMFNRSGGFMAEGKKSLMSHFKIADRSSCEKAIKNGGIAALISAGITAIFAGFGFFTTSSNKDLAYLLTNGARD
jgi:hypothetical protein